MPGGPRAITIGTFDGVHLGHRALIRRARSLAPAATGGEVVVLAFDPSPTTVLRPATAPARLTDFESRRELLLDAGADRVERLEPTRELLGLSAEAFIRRLAERERPTAVVEGPDFRFGRGRAGGTRELKELGERFGFEVVIVDPVEVVLTDHSVAPARSTMARWLLEHGRVRDAAALLGRAHAVRGTVVQGDRRGRRIGVPTANLLVRAMLPADGIYAGRATLEDGRTFAAAVHVGERPTFENATATVEAHLLDAPTVEGESGARVIEGLDEYGWSMRLEFTAWLRDNVRFDSVDELVAQMHRDCDRAREVVRAEGGRVAVATARQEEAVS